MDIRQMRTFIEVCKHMSFSKAAQNMYISQQGVSRCIRSLESELGVPLFSRNQSSISLTEYGTLFLKYAKSVCLETENLVADLDSLKEQHRSEIRIGIPLGMTNFMPDSLLSPFAAKHPDVTLSLTECDDYELDNALLNGSIDIALCIDPVSYDNFVIHHTHKETTYFMVSDKHPIAKKNAIDLRELKNESFISFGPTTKGHILFEERCRKAGFSPKISVRTRDMNLINKLVKSGMGIGFFVGDPSTEISGVRIIPDKFPNWVYTIHVCTLEGHSISSLEADLIKVLSHW